MSGLPALESFNIDIFGDEKEREPFGVFILRFVSGKQSLLHKKIVQVSHFPSSF